MNRTEQLARNAWREKYIFDIAVRDDVVTLNDLWRKTGWVHYGYLSRLLLRWWREDGLLLRLNKKGKWVTGQIFSTATRNDFPGYAIYKWND